MPEQKRRVLIYSTSEEKATAIRSILTKILDVNKYEIDRLQYEDVIKKSTDGSWSHGIDALIVDNDGGREQFDDKIRAAFLTYFLNSGRIVFLSNPDDGQNALWMLKEASTGEGGVPFPESVGRAYEKFARNEPVPANLQAFQVHKSSSNSSGDQGKDESSGLIDYAVGLVRGASELSYMYFICEDGDTAVFVVAKALAEAPHFATGQSQARTESFWKDVFRVLRVLGVETLPISASQAAKRWTEGDSTTTTTGGEEAHQRSSTTGGGHGERKIRVYLGPNEEEKSKKNFDDLSTTLRKLIANDEKYSIDLLRHEQLHGGGDGEWKSDCSVLFVDNRDWTSRFDEKTRKELAAYFSESGRVVFFCDPKEGRKAMWLLHETSKPDEQWPEAVGKAYEHFAQNQPIPTDLQAIQMHKGDNMTSLSLGLIKGANGAFTYLKCEDGDTAVFVAMTIDEVLTRGHFIWHELLRVIELPQAMSPTSQMTPAPGTGFTRLVKYINTGAAAAADVATDTASSIFSGLTKFLKGDEDRSMTKTPSSRKPPNLLIYASENGGGEKKFEGLSTTLREFVSADRYTIYRLKKDQIVGGGSRVPWSTNCRVLFVDNDQPIDETVRKSMADYFLRDDGKLVFFSNPRDARQSLWLLDTIAAGAGGTKSSWPDVIGEAFERFVRTGDRVIPTTLEHFSLPGREDECAVNFVGGMRGSPPILHFMGGRVTQGDEHTGAEAVFVGSNMESVCAEKGEDVWKEILGAVGLELETEEKVKMVPLQNAQAPSAGIFYKDEELATKAKESHSKSLIDLPSVKARVGDQPSKEPELQFAKDVYFQNLKTKQLGHVVIYAPVVTSTMPISDDWHNLFNKDDYVVITKRQTQGQGRSGNQWLSPIGSALFSICVCVPQKTPLGKRLSFLQHLVTLAAADSIHGLNQALDVRIKWPNDIYYGKDTKIGGVLVKANFVKEQFTVFVGAGINVSNRAPTVCLNQHLPTDAEKLTPEKVIAVTLNRLEQLIEEFQSKGASAVLPLYYKYWLHGDHEVTVASTGERVKIVGLDEYGFLNVKAIESGRTFTLHPDGNSFDMMTNLIEGKESSASSSPKGGSPAK